MAKAYEGDLDYIFVSYAHADSDVVLPIIDALQNEGYRVWYDEGIEWAAEWPENIANHVYACSRFLAFVSYAFVLSDNCRDEVVYARENRKEMLVVYLEDIDLDELNRGLKLQLGRRQAKYRSRYESDEKFVAELLEQKVLEPCLTEEAARRRKVRREVVRQAQVVLATTGVDEESLQTALSALQSLPYQNREVAQLIKRINDRVAQEEALRKARELEERRKAEEAEREGLEQEKRRAEEAAQRERELEEKRKAEEVERKRREREERERHEAERRRAEEEAQRRRADAVLLAESVLGASQVGDGSLQAALAALQSLPDQQDQEVARLVERVENRIAEEEAARKAEEAESEAREREEQRKREAEEAERRRAEEERRKAEQEEQRTKAVERAESVLGEPDADKASLRAALEELRSLPAGDAEVGRLVKEIEARIPRKPNIGLPVIAAVAALVIVVVVIMGVNAKESGTTLSSGAATEASSTSAADSTGSNGGDVSSDAVGVSGVAVKSGIADYKWSELKSISQAIATANGDDEGLEIAKAYNLVDVDGKLRGDTKGMTLTNDRVVKAHILGFRHDELASGDIAGITFAFEEVRENRVMNDAKTNLGGWKSSGMRLWLNSDFLALLPSSFRQCVEDTKKHTNNVGKVGASETSAVTTTSDKFWLLSVTEVYGTTVGELEGSVVLDTEGTQYQLYSDHDVTIDSHDYCDGDADINLRSPDPADSECFYSIKGTNGGGWAVAYADDTGGFLSVGFCL